MGEERMNIPLTLVVSLAAALSASIARKYFSSKNPSGGKSGVFVFNAVCSITAAIVLLLWGGFGACSVYTVILGIIFGAITALQGFSNISALGCGPMSYTQVIVSFSTLITALSGVLFFHESLGWAQIVGIVLMLASFALATERKADEKRANLKWLILCLISFAATGGIGIMQKVHQSSAHRGELNAFLIIAFVVSTALSTLFSFVLKSRENKTREKNEKKRKQAWHLLAVMLICGVCVAANNKFNLYLSGVMDSAVFFPIVNGGGLVLSTLAALVLFRERLSKKQWVGVALGILSVVFLCNPFA